MLAFIVILSVVFLTSIIAFFVINGKGSAIKNTKVVLFTLLFAVVISALGFSGLMSSVTTSILYFVLLQVVSLGLGYLTFFLLKKNFWGEFENEKVSKALFVLANCSAGMIGFSLVFARFGDSILAPYYSMSAITFVLPQFMSVAFNVYASIPQEIYKVWYFPTHADEIDFDKIDTSNVYMLELEYSKSVNDSRLINSKVRAPLGMKYGDWFRSFIENYNDRYDSDPIHYLNRDNTPHGWIFFVKPSFFGTAKYIDPNLTITENRLSEKNKIIAKRVEVVNLN